MTHKLPACHYESTYVEVIQPLEVEPRCLWNAGECGQVFDDVWEFYSHVCNHIRGGDSDGTCLWEGKGSAL